MESSQDLKNGLTQWDKQFGKSSSPRAGFAAITLLILIFRALVIIVERVERHLK